LAASRSDYPFTCIASVTLTFVAGLAWHAMKKHAAFSARSSALYSFLFEDMLKCLLPRDGKWVAQTMFTRERETVVVKSHYAPPLKTTENRSLLV
jgi:hypothetical protein